MNPSVLVDFTPAARLALLAALIALLPLSWVWLRARGADTRSRLAALTAVTLFLTFDLVVFGAFTRLTDSGLGCPDWPGCYGDASPLGAHDAIEAAQSAMPAGPVTFAKAWIEMIHRYLAMTVGVLILALAAVSVHDRQRLPQALAWPLATLVWVLVQGLFGKYTVTLKLYPAIVALHLMGGITLVALLAVQHAAYADPKDRGHGGRQHGRQHGQAPTLPPSLRHAGFAVGVMLAAQIALGAWVSSNYAVLACTGFPQCSGSWWPEMDFQGGYTVLRELGGLGSQGQPLTLAGLVAIHYTHRLFAGVLTVALALFVWRLRRSPEAAVRRQGALLGALLLLQGLTGLTNVVLGWPLLAALAHTGGACALVLVLARLLARGAPRRVAPGPSGLVLAA
jgi:cytochrome c oxidase assembly protein subunit 15